MDTMRASECLSAEEGREFLYEIESARAAFSRDVSAP